MKLNLEGEPTTMWDVSSTHSTNSEFPSVLEFLNNLSLGEAARRSDELQIPINYETEPRIQIDSWDKDIILSIFETFQANLSTSPDADSRLEALDGFILSIRGLYLSSVHREKVYLYAFEEAENEFRIFRQTSVPF
jgi:hypothetical protein